MKIHRKKICIHLDAAVHQALQHKALQSKRSISGVISETLRVTLAEDAEDLEAFAERQYDPLVTYESLLKQLKEACKL